MSTKDIQTEPQMVQNMLKNNTWIAADVSLMICVTLGNCNSTEVFPGHSFIQYLHRGTEEICLQCSQGTTQLWESFWFCADHQNAMWTWRAKEILCSPKCDT